MRLLHALSSFVAAALLSTAAPARAEFIFVDSDLQSISTVCPATGATVTAASSLASYLADDSALFPNTGDVTYVRGLVGNFSGCVDDVVGFEFFLPDGAELAISVDTPVFCTRINFDGTGAEDVPNCLQTPSTGRNGGAFFGSSSLAPGQLFEVLVPVGLTRQLLGPSGPPSHRFTLIATSAYGVMRPSLPVTVFYRAELESFRLEELTPNSAVVGFDLFSYFKSGLISLEFGTTPNLGSSTEQFEVPDDGVGFEVTLDLTALNPGTRYFYRARYQTVDGSFVSETQSLTTPTASGSPSE